MLNLTEILGLTCFLFKHFSRNSSQTGLGARQFYLEISWIFSNRIGGDPQCWLDWARFCGLHAFCPEISWKFLYRMAFGEGHSIWKFPGTFQIELKKKYNLALKRKYNLVKYPKWCKSLFWAWTGRISELRTWKLVDSAQNFVAELLGHVLSPKRFKNVWKSKKMRNIGKVKPCKIMFFGLNEAYMGAQELKIGGFGAEIRDEAIGIGLRT